jgi:uncharacterized protein (TIGR02301 family)
MKHRAAIVCAALAVAILATTPLAAQRRGAPEEPPPAEAPPPPPPVLSDDRPYDNKLLRLSEILGAVHYLRELCGADEGQVWRQEMQSLVKSEGVTAVRRAKLVKSFNNGYRGYRRTYRACTPSASTAITRFLQEGALLSASLAKDAR